MFRACYSVSSIQPPLSFVLTQLGKSVTFLSVLDDEGCRQGLSLVVVQFRCDVQTRQE